MAALVGPREEMLKLIVMEQLFLPQGKSNDCHITHH
jgi:hypothetical protein